MILIKVDIKSTYYVRGKTNDWKNARIVRRAILRHKIIEQDLEQDTEHNEKQMYTNTSVTSTLSWLQRKMNIMRDKCIYCICFN